MLKISEKGLDEISDKYYNYISKIIKKNIEESSIDENLKNYFINNLKRILIGKYDTLNDIIEYLEERFCDKYKDDFGEMKKIFQYSVLYSNNLRHKILNKIGINVCPYCGRQFISSYDEKTSAELDHFFCQSKYPYLALSLYNFIPCCHLCNTTFKRDKDFNENEHLYPYTEGFEEEAKFDIDNSVLITDFVNGLEEAELFIDYDKKNKKIKNNIKTFRLNSVYQNHSKDVRKLLRLIQNYNNTYLESIAKTLLSGNAESNIIVQKSNELMNIVFREKDNDEILSKLHNDILDKYWKNNKF